MSAIRRPDRANEWWVDFRWRGRRIRKRAPLQTRRGAEEFERQLRNEFSQGEAHGVDRFGGPPPKFEEFSGRWMREYVAPRNRASTRYSKESALRTHLVPTFGAQRLNEITTARIDAFIADTRRWGLAPKTINNVLSMLLCALRTDQEWGLLHLLPKRHGVLDLYAALNVATGEVAHACTDSHTAADFLGFMQLIARLNPRKELHVVLDNSSTHSTPKIRAWLSKNPRIRFHYTPTSASWLNQVEGFFGILAKQSLRATDFPSKKALKAHLASYIAGWNQDPTPFLWTKPAAAIIRSHRRMLDRISVPVH